MEGTYLRLNMLTSQQFRRIYKAIANRTAKTGYRADLREAVVARASALRQSQRPKKDTPETKARGAKARKAAAKDSS
jgi:large subunit ribosomal protein L28e